MRKIFFMLVSCFALASLGQVPCRWEVESSRSAPGQFTCYRGETLHLQPTIKEYGAAMSNYTATLYYQTNGMGTAWWTGTNGMYFTPAMDIGASAYTVYIRAAKTNGISYRANAVIKMLGSPGSTPNTIALPVQRIDFASTSYVNAPWLLTESDPGIPAAVSNAVAQASANSQAMANAAQSNAVAIAGTNAQAIASAALSNAVSFAASNLTTRLFNPSNLSEYIDGTGRKYIISNFWEMTLPTQIMDSTYYPAPTLSNYVFTGYAEYYETIGSSFSATHWTFGYSEAEGFYVRAFRFLSGMQWLATTNQYVLSNGNWPAYGFVYIRHYSTTNLIATLASQAEVVSATAGLVSTNETRHVRLNTLTVTNAVTAPDGTTVIIPRTRSLVDSASITAADWENRYLYSSGGRLRLDWEGAILTSYHPVYGYSQSLDWINRALMDSDEHTAMAWGDRNLQFPTAGIAIDWSVDNAVTINGGVSMPGSVLAETELHRDSFTNIIWRSVYSNGWMWLVAYTNYPAQ